MKTLFSQCTWKSSWSVVVSAILILILLGAYMGIPKGIEMIRMKNIRDNHLSSYAGCEMKILNPDDIEPKGNYATMAGVVEYINKNWEVDSYEYHFNHEDVVEYMMSHCPPKSDNELEVAYSGRSLDGWKRSRDYKLKFINKDLDIFKK